jgi:hypothetical protein
MGAQTARAGGRGISPPPPISAGRDRRSAPGRAGPEMISDLQMNVATDHTFFTAAGQSGDLMRS